MPLGSSVTTREEAETIIRWDEASDMATVFTASSRFAAKAAKWGWALTVKSTFDGEPRTWEGQVPKRIVRMAKRATFERKRTPHANAMAGLAKSRSQRKSNT